MRMDNSSTRVKIFFLTLLLGCGWADISGYIVKAKHWNNYGYKIVLYEAKTKRAEIKTSINGYFAFKVPTGNYELYVYDGSAVLALRQVQSPGLVQLRLDHSKPSFYPVEIIGFFMAVFILGLGVSTILLQRQTSGLLFGAMALSFALINGIEWLQSVLALSNEIMAGTIFSLKHIGVVWFGIFLLFFVQNLSRQRLLSGLVFIGLVETIILASWAWFGSDQAYNAFWGFPYDLVRALAVVQTFIAIVYSYILAVRTGQRTLLKTGLLWFLLLFGLLVLVPVLVRQGTEFFAWQYNSAASFGGLILFLSLFSVLMTFKVRGVEQFLAGSLLYSIMSIVLVGIYAVLIVTFGYFVQHAKNELLNIYALLIVISAVLPFKDILQKYLERRLLGHTQKYQEALTLLTESLVSAGTFSDVQNILRRIFKKYFGVSVRLVRGHTEAALSFRLYTVQPVTLVISCPLGKVFDQADLVTFQRYCTTIALALDRVFASEQQLRALEEIEQQSRLASLGTLTAGLAHEIKNPLTVLHNIISVLPKASKLKLTSDYIPLLQRQVERMQGLLQNMLQFARPEKLQFRKINLRTVVERSVALIAATARKHNIEVGTNLLDCPIQGDEQALEQVILNICLNALESMPKGGKLLLVLKRRTLTITDSGVGLSAEAKKHLFEPFFTTKANGTGLGLAVSRRILEKHQARVMVDSQLNKGTTFTLVFRNK